MRFVFQCSLALSMLASLQAQAPKSPDSSFFAKDSKELMRICAEEARMLQKKDSHILAEIGDIYLTLGERSKAEEVFREALELKDVDGEAFHLVGKAWLRHGFKAEAMKAFEGTSLRGGGQWGGWDNPKNIMKRAAMDLMDAGYPKEAEALMDRAYLIDTKDAENCYQFGRSALLAGQREIAATWFLRAIKAGPKDEEVWVEIANAYADLLKKTPKQGS